MKVTKTDLTKLEIELKKEIIDLQKFVEREQQAFAAIQKTNATTISDLAASNLFLTILIQNIIAHDDNLKVKIIADLKQLITQAGLNEKSPVSRGMIEHAQDLLKLLRGEYPTTVN